MDLVSFQVPTNKRTQFLDITHEVTKIVKKSSIGGGVCTVYTPHTTAALTVNEHADPAVINDIIETMNRIIPLHGSYTHSEGNSAAHIKASLLGSSVSIPVSSDSLTLGTWQGIFFCEFDGPRRRTVHVQLTGNVQT